MPYPLSAGPNRYLYANPFFEAFRPPDWRWQLSRVGGKARGDVWGLRLLTLPERPSQTIAAARALLDGEPLRHAELVARILANDSVENIARKCQLTKPIVVAFEAVFFDVRCRRQFKGWVTHQVLKTTLRTGDIAQFWMSYGYRFGLNVLEHLIAGADREQLLELGMDAYRLPDCRLSPHVKSLIAIDCMPLPRTPAEMELFLSSDRMIKDIVREINESSPAG